VDAETELMRKMMGFSGFSSTKGEDHTADAQEGIKKQTQRKYRQYMNRRGGIKSSDI